MGGNIRYDQYIKKPNAEHEYTAEEIRELIKCKSNPSYFMKKYIKIVHQDKGVINFVPYEYQEDLINKFEESRFNICLLSRQSGKSTIVAAYALWYACFHDHKNIGIVSNKAEAAKSFLSRLKYMYELLPFFIKPGVPGWAQTTIEFDNHTKLYIAATSKDSFRGEPMGMLLCDEFAFVEPQWKADEFWASNYPTISASKDSKIIIISTPNGMHNKFHEIYTNAELKRNSFIATKYDWRVVPGRDEVWAEEQKQNLGKIKFNQEFGCEFLGSSNTVIDSDCLERLIARTRDAAFFDMNNRLRVYEKPIDGAEYVMGVDVAKGTGEHFSTVQVFRVESITPVRMHQVAVFEDNFTDVYTFAEIVNRLSHYYNGAYMMVENNGEGAPVVNRIWWEYENENLVNTGTKQKDLGIRATTTTKPRAVLLMKKLIEDGSLTIPDQKTIDQLTDFIDKGNGRFGGGNIADDLVSSLYWCCYILEMGLFEESYEFVKREVEEEEDAWGILADIENMVDDDWSWMNDGVYK